MCAPLCQLVCSAPAPLLIAEDTWFASEGRASMLLLDLHLAVDCFNLLYTVCKLANFTSVPFSCALVVFMIPKNHSRCGHAMTYLCAGSLLIHESLMAISISLF